MHIRRIFLNAFKAQLKTIPEFSKRVWNQRTPPKNQWPCILVYSATESVATETIHPAPRPQARTLNFSVSLFINGTQDEEKLEADIDTYTALIESVIKAPEGVNDLQLLETGFPQVFQDEEKLEVAEIIMTYALSYITTEFSPT
jgi:hypothetical protein